VVTALLLRGVQLLADNTGGTDLPSFAPSSTGLPGGSTLASLVSGLMYIGLVGASAAVIVGGATWWLSAQNGHYGGAMGGRRAVMAGIIGALLIGASVVITHFFYAQGSSVPDPSVTQTVGSVTGGRA
jgi:hypothetical protein